MTVYSYSTYVSNITMIVDILCNTIVIILISFPNSIA